MRELLGVSDMAFWASDVEDNGVGRRQPFQQRRIALAGQVCCVGDVEWKSYLSSCSAELVLWVGAAVLLRAGMPH